tara:strand:+ start:134 stop:1069 length:936 start_codon:yes stop_codon:yes gene_type:complete
MSKQPSKQFKFPAGCAVSLTYCDVGENEPGMEKLGQATSHPVTVKDLLAMKLQFEQGQTDGKAAPGVAEIFDLKAAMDGVDVGGLEVRGASVLVMRNFTDHVLGKGTLAQIESELESMKQDGLTDSKALMRGQVKNKNARHNNVIADFEQSPDIAKGRGTVVPFRKYDALLKMRNMAAMWMQQDHPLVAEQNRYFDVASCGIGWHGDAERDVVWGLRVGEATRAMPLMFQAYTRSEPIGPKTTIHLAPGDVYVMSNVAVGKDWHFSSRLTWRHAAGAPSCSYSKDPTPKVAKPGKTIAKASKIVRKSAFLK